MTAAVASSDLKSRSSFSENTVPVSRETPRVLSRIEPLTFITLKSVWLSKGPIEMNRNNRAAISVFILFCFIQSSLQEFSVMTDAKSIPEIPFNKYN
jgi:hypothetical protein